MARNLSCRPGSSRLLSALALAAMLAACGGGGGDDSGPGSLALTTANRDPVARATVAGLYSMLSPGGLALDGTMQSSARSGPLLSRVTALARQGLDTRRQRLDATRVAPAVVIGPEVQPCPFGGSLSLTWDDRDNSNSLTAGDTMTLVATACRDSDVTRMDGTVTFQFTSVNNGALGAFVARTSMSQLTLQDGARTISMDGTVLVDYAMLSTSTERTRVSADGSVTVTMQTPVINDTLTLSSGFWVETFSDMNAAPPESPFDPGRVAITTGGLMSSSRAGGSFSVGTTTALTDYWVDEFPRSGVIRIEGRTGVERLTVLNSSSVRVELDAAGDGVFESADVVGWDWLI